MTRRASQSTAISTQILLALCLAPYHANQNLNGIRQSYRLSHEVEHTIPASNNCPRFLALSILWFRKEALVLRLLSFIFFVLFPAPTSASRLSIAMLHSQLPFASFIQIFLRCCLGAPHSWCHHNDTYEGVRMR